MATSLQPSVAPGASGDGGYHSHDGPLYDDEDDAAYDFYSDSGGETSDDEVDWDPDRERLLRMMRAQQGGTPGASHRSLGSGSDASTPSRSLNERRNEWRAKRGLGRQKTVQELIAEKRAQRQLFGAGPPGAAPVAAQPPAAATLDLSAASLSIDPMKQGERNSPAPTATDESVDSSSRNGSSSSLEGGGHTSRRKSSILGWVRGRK